MVTSVGEIYLVSFILKIPALKMQTIFKNYKISKVQQQKTGLQIFKEDPTWYVEQSDQESSVVTQLKQKNPYQNAKNKYSFNDFTGFMEQNFSNDASIHGIKQIFARVTGKIERIMWCIGFLTAFTLLIYVSYRVAERYQRSQFNTVVETTNLPISNIPFPELTVCNENRLNWDRLKEAKDLYLKAEHHSEMYLQLFSEILSLYDTFTFGQFDLFANLSDQQLQTFNYINFTSLVQFMAWRCDEILQDCVWRLRRYNCCEIFFPRNSQLGACLAFNTIESLQGKLMQRFDSYWPWHNDFSGPGTGLNFKVLLRDQKHSPFSVNSKGLLIMIVEPSVWFHDNYKIQANTKTTISIHALLTFYDNQTRSVPSSERECVFNDERESADFKTLPGHDYRYENCLSLCQQEHLLRYCNCTVDLFYPPGPHPSCKLIDFSCLAKHNNQLLVFDRPGQDAFINTNTTGMKCKCFVNCYSVKYIIDMRSTILTESEKLSNESYVMMDYFYRQGYMLVYKTKLVYTWDNLLVSFGGIAGLFLGCSIISAMELIYFFLLDAPFWFWQTIKMKWRKKVQKRKVQGNVNKLLNAKK